MTVFYIFTLSVITAWIVSMVLIGKKIKRIESFIEHRGVGHSLIEGNEMNPIAFYIGLMRCRPAWLEKEKEIEGDILSFIILVWAVLALTCLSGITTFGTLWNLLTK